MQRISITNPQNIIDGTAKKYYFKLRNTGGPKGDKGDKGDTGQTGPQGPKGDAATVAIGSTTTLPVGYNATVENVGSIYNAVLNFGIPQGPQGPRGAKGDKGDTGAQGETGPRGQQGEKGTNATVYVGTTTTTNPGTQARVYNSGTDSNAVLNFEIPRGDVGPMPTIAQTTGQAIDQVMSQKATTDALATKQNTIDSSHKLSADLVTDTTTTNKFVTASDKTTWNAKQNALTAGDNITISGDTISAIDTTYTAGNNIDITGTTISTPAIAPEVVAELPATGAEGKLYLTPKNYTRGTGTGNPIEAAITDEAGKMESFKLDGDTFQQTYTGKNLLDTAKCFGGGINGNTGVVSEGLVELTTTSTSIRAYSSTNNFKGAVTEKISLDVGDKVTLSWERGNETTQQYACIFFYDANDAFLSKSAQIDGYTTLNVTATAPSNVAYARCALEARDVGTVVTFYNPMLEKSASATDFEPYVGGIKSPNPDYPQPIQTVTGEQTVEVVGKNRIGTTDNSASGYGLTAKVEGDTITVDGTATAVLNLCPAKFDLTGLGGTKPAISIIPISGSWTGGSIGFSLRDSSNSQIFFQQQKFDGTLFRSNILPDSALENADHAYIFAGATGVFSNFKFKIMMTTSTTVETDFVPYSKQTYPINLGKNLFDNTGWRQGQYNNGEWTDNLVTRVTTPLIPIEPTTYTISLNSESLDTAFININYFDSSKNWLGNRSTLGLPAFGNVSREQTFTLPRGASYLAITIRPYGEDGANIQDLAQSSLLMLEKGSSKTSYAPYKTPIELCKLDTYQDYIWKDGEDWKLHKETGTVAANAASDKTWIKSGQSTSSVFVAAWTNMRTGGYVHTLDDRLLAQSFAYRNTTTANTGRFNRNVGSTEYDYLLLRFDISVFDTLDKVKTWLNNNPQTVYYSLATPTDTTITDTNLIAQLEAIRTAALQNGTNTITNTAAGSNLAGDMEVGYYEYDPRNRYDKWLWLDLNNAYEQLNNPDTSATRSTRSLATTTEQPTVTRSLETETITLKKGETEPIEEKTELPTILDDKTEETETIEPEESGGADER